MNMALTASHMSDIAALGRLAANPSGTSREEIYVAVTSLYRVQGARLTARERDLMQDIVRMLTPHIPLGIRIGLADRLADDASAPHELILLFANDVVEAARPVILRNLLLTDADLLRLIAEAGVAHQEAVAARPYLGESVTDALAQCEAESVLVTLVRNASARLSPAACETLLGKARQSVTILTSLTMREDLPRAISEALKEFSAFVASENTSTAVPAPSAPATEGENKLIEKLAASGQLRASFLLRVLNQGQIDLFDAGLAKLLGIPLADLQDRFYQGGPKAVALACRAIGIDRCVFQTIYTLSRKAHGMLQPLHSHDMADVEAAFRTSKPAALDLLQAA
jgi:uncharacterized protein (DUF2336 family)